MGRPTDLPCGKVHVGRSLGLDDVTSDAYSLCHSSRTCGVTTGIQGLGAHLRSRDIDRLMLRRMLCDLERLLLRLLEYLRLGERDLE